MKKQTGRTKEVRALLASNTKPISATKYNNLIKKMEATGQISKPTIK